MNNIGVKNSLELVKIIEHNKDCLKTLGYEDPKINIFTQLIDTSTFYALKTYSNYCENDNITPILCFTKLKDITGYLYTMIRRGFDCISDINESHLHFDINTIEQNSSYLENGNLEIELNDMKYIYRQLEDNEWLNLSNLLTDEHKIKKTKCKFKGDACKC